MSLRDDANRPTTSLLRGSSEYPLNESQTSLQICIESDAFEATDDETGSVILGITKEEAAGAKTDRKIGIREGQIGLGSSRSTSLASW